MCEYVLSEICSSDSRSVSSDFGLIDWNHQLNLHRNTRAKVSLKYHICKLVFIVEIGLVCGAESISNLVEEKIASKIAQDYPNRAWVLDQFRRQFDELYKSRFGAEDDETYNFNLPNLECDLSR